MQLTETIKKPTKNKALMRKGILAVEYKMHDLPGAMVGDCYPLKHSFADGIYIREINVPENQLIVTKIFKQSHATFLLEGECSILTENGATKVKAPYHIITNAGTKRVIYTHSSVVWITVHSNPDNQRDLDLIEDNVIAKTFDELPTQEDVEQLTKGA
jgi:hypothetical protein